MPRVHCRTVFDAARARGCGIAAFNVVTLEHADGIVEAAERLAQPVILQLSQNAIRFHRGPDAIAAGMVAAARRSSVPVALHLDHVTDVALAARTAELGFSSVMFDGSSLDDEANTAATAAVVRTAEADEVWTEAELGEIGGKGGAHVPGVRTDPDDARAFVERTGVDALAVAVGSSHAMRTRDAEIDLELVARLRRAVPVPLVLHGSSGVPDASIRAACAAGLVKVNVGTALNLAYMGAVRSCLAADPDLVDPRRMLAPARSALARTAARFLEVISGPAPG